MDPNLMPRSKGGVWGGAAPPALQADGWEKSIKNLPKIDQKTIENIPKIHQKSTKIDLPGVAREPREASWGFLKYKGLLERLPWGLLGRPEGVLGPSWWPTWPQLGPQNGAKIDKKLKQKMIKMLMPLETRCLSYFDWFWVDFGGMLVSKMD